MLTVEDLLEIRKDYLQQTATLENPDKTITGVTMGLLLLSKPLRHLHHEIEAKESTEQEFLPTLESALRIAIEMDKREPNLDQAARVAMTRLEKILCPNVSELALSITTLDEAIVNVERHSYLIQNPDNARCILKAIRHANQATDEELLARDQFQFKLDDEPSCTHVFVFHTENYIEGGIKQIRDTLVRLKLEIIAAWNEAVKRNELSIFLNDFNPGALCLEGATRQALDNTLLRSTGSIVPGIGFLPDNFQQIFSVCYPQARNFLAVLNMQVSHGAIEKIILKAHDQKCCLAPRPNDVKQITQAAVVDALNTYLSEDSYFFVDEKAKLAEIFKGFPLLTQFRLLKSFQAGYLGVEMAQEMKVYADNIVQIIMATRYSKAHQAIQFAKILKDTDNFCTPIFHHSSFIQAAALFHDTEVSRVLCDMAWSLIANRSDESGAQILKHYLSDMKLWACFAILLEKTLDNREAVLLQIPEELWHKNKNVLNVLAAKPVVLEQLIKTKPEFFWELLSQIISSTSVVVLFVSTPKGVSLLKQLLEKYPSLNDVISKNSFLLKNVRIKDTVSIQLIPLYKNLSALEGAVLQQKLADQPLIKEYQTYSNAVDEEKTLATPIQDKIMPVLHFFKRLEKTIERDKAIVEFVIASVMNDELMPLKQLHSDVPRILREEMRLNEEDCASLQSNIQEILSKMIKEKEYKLLSDFFEKQIFTIKNVESVRQTLAKIRSLSQLIVFSFAVNGMNFFSLMQANRSLVSLIPIPVLLMKSSAHKMSLMEAMVDAKIQKTTDYNEANDAKDLILFFEELPLLATALPPDFWAADVTHERKKMPRLAWIIKRLKPLFDFIVEKNKTLFHSVPPLFWNVLLIELSSEMQTKVAELLQWKPAILSFDLFVDQRFVMAFAQTPELIHLYPLTKWYETIITGNNALYHLSFGNYGVKILETLIEKFPMIVTKEPLDWLLSTSQNYPAAHQMPLYVLLFSYFQRGNIVRATELFRKYPDLFLRLPRTIWHLPLTEKGYEGLTAFYLFLLPLENVELFNRRLKEDPSIANTVTREVLCRKIEYPECKNSSLLHLLSSENERVVTMKLLLQYNPDAFRPTNEFDYEAPWIEEGKLPFKKKRHHALSLLNELDIGIELLNKMLDYCPVIATSALMKDSDLFDLAYFDRLDLLEKLVNINADFACPETAIVLFGDGEHPGDTLFYHLCRTKQGRAILRKVIDNEGEIIKHIPSKSFYRKTNSYNHSAFQELCASDDPDVEFALYLLTRYPSLAKRITPEILVPKREQSSQSSVEGSVDSQASTVLESDEVNLLEPLYKNRDSGWKILKLFAQNDAVRAILPPDVLACFHMETIHEEKVSHPVTQYVMQRSQHVIACLDRLSSIRNNANEEKNSTIRSKVLVAFREIVSNYNSVDQLNELKQAISATDFDANSIISFMKEENTTTIGITFSPNSGSNAFQKMLTIIDAKLQALQSPQRVHATARTVKRSFSQI